MRFPVVFSDPGLLAGSRELTSTQLTCLSVASMSAKLGLLSLHSSQKVTGCGEECLLEMAISGLDEGASWIMSFGGGYEVLAPKELKEKVIAGLRKGFERHGVGRCKRCRNASGGAS